ANAKGVSNAVAVGIDDLPQAPFTPEPVTLPVALHGSIPGSASVVATFTGKKGQRIVAEVEARRLGSALDPLLELYNAGRVQVAWAQGLPRLGGDARLEALLPADGKYAVELRDVLYQGANPSYYRLKIG